MHPNSLANLEMNRQPKYLGDQEKVRTQLSLSKTSREFLSKGGAKMSEMIEFMVYCFTEGEFGLLPFGEIWRSQYERWQEKLNPPQLNSYQVIEHYQVQINDMADKLGKVEAENNRLYQIRQQQDAEINSLKSRLEQRDDAIAKLQAELETARSELDQLNQTRTQHNGNQLPEVNSESDPATFTDWLDTEIEKDCYKPVKPYASSNAGNIYTRNELLNLISASRIKGVGHGEKFQDSKGNWWQCLRKEGMRSPLSSFQFEGVKVLFVGLENDRDSWTRYV